MTNPIEHTQDFNTLVSWTNDSEQNSSLRVDRSGHLYLRPVELKITDETGFFTKIWLSIYKWFSEGITGTTREALQDLIPQVLENELKFRISKIDFSNLEQSALNLEETVNITLQLSSNHKLAKRVGEVSFYAFNKMATALKVLKEQDAPTAKVLIQNLEAYTAELLKAFNEQQENQVADVVQEEEPSPVPSGDVSDAEEEAPQPQPEPSVVQFLKTPESWKKYDFELDPLNQ